MNNAFRVLGFFGLLTVGLSGLTTLGGCGADKSSRLLPDGAAGAAGTKADGAAGQSSDGKPADGAAPDSRRMDGAIGGAMDIGSADAARVGDAGGVTGFDAPAVDLGSSPDLGSGGKDAAGTGGAGDSGAGGTGGGTGGTGTGGSGTGGTDGGTETGGSGGPSCPAGLPSGSDATFCVGNVLYDGIPICYDGGCTCVGVRHVTCLNGCVKNAANPGGTCSGGFLVCPKQGSSTRRSICFLGAVYSVASACSPTAGCNCKISQSKICTGVCVELSDGSAECQ